MNSPPAIRLSPVLLVIFMLSGVAGLGYQIVWTRVLAVGLGHELPSVLAVVAAFMGGLALGAWTLDAAISGSRRPGRWYAGLELTIAVWGLATTLLLPRLNDAAPGWIGIDPSPLRHWSIAFGLPLLALLPATAAMGATLTAMDRLLAIHAPAPRVVGAVYAANTLGAVCGTLGATFWLLPAFGQRATTLVLAGGNGACALLVLLRFAGAGPQQEVDAAQASPHRATPARRTNVNPPLGAAGSEKADARSHRTSPERLSPEPASRARLLLIAAATGLLGIGYEVLGVRVMAQALENTVYTFAVALAVFLLGTAVGGAIFQRWLREREFHLTLAVLLQVTTIAILCGILVLATASTMFESTRAALGGGMTGAILAEAALAMLVFFVPTVSMGATFSLLAQAARTARGGVGRILAANTLGGALTPWLLGVVLLPAIGSKWALTLVALGYVALVTRAQVRRLAPALVAVPILIVLTPARLALVRTAPGSRELAFREGVMGATVVFETAERERILKINDRFQQGGTGRGEFAHGRQGHLPLLLHAAPRRALFLGVGTGVALATAGLHADLEADGVELVPDVVDVLPLFAAATGDLGRNPRLRVYVADARRFVRARREHYDVVVADLFHPHEDGAGMLYTREHFEAIRSRLAPGGLFCQWLPLYQLDLDSLRMILRSYLAVFPHAQAWLAHFNVETPMVALISGVDRPVRLPADWCERRVAAGPLAQALTRLALRSDMQLMGCFLGSAERLRAFSGPGLLNTDDRPLVTYLAPRFAYSAKRPAHERLEALIAALQPAPDELLELESGQTQPAATVRLSAYWAARDEFFRARVAQSEGRQAEAVARLRRSVENSPEFGPSRELLRSLSR
ncbi:Spermidine synthase [Phycisphaerae bacterium RAS1]|nr:Spermidine synthase [Phycisphaerae bacterium RAS1]